MKSFFLLLICSLFIGCSKVYKRTLKVCDNKLYIEVFSVNPAGVDVDYLTDSLNFRLYVGKWDNEHENFHYTCKGDSIIIEKMARMDTTSFMKVIETKVYSLKDLKTKGKFE
jgi:hypothetical protein